MSLCSNSYVVLERKSCPPKLLNVLTEDNFVYCENTVQDISEQYRSKKDTIKLEITDLNGDVYLISKFSIQDWGYTD